MSNNNAGADIVKVAISLLTKKTLLILSPIILVAVFLLLLIVMLTYQSQTMLPFTEEEINLVETEYKNRQIDHPTADDIVGSLVFFTVFKRGETITLDNVKNIVSPFIKSEEKEVLSIITDTEGNSEEKMIKETVYSTKNYIQVMSSVATQEELILAEQLFNAWIQIISLQEVGGLPEGYVVSSSLYTFPAPTVNVITSKFGARWGRQHLGVDISGYDPVGEPIVAANSGTITEVNKNPKHACGLYVRIKHQNGDQTRYCHLNSIIVEKGNLVMKGAVIGGLGNTGNSTGPHLHFELKINGVNVDPLPYIIGSMNK